MPGLCPFTISWAQFKDPDLHTCFASTVGASWPLTQEMAGLSPFSNKYFFVTEFSEIFRKKSDIVLTPPPPTCA